MKHLPYTKRILIRLKELEKQKEKAELDLEKIISEQKELETFIKIFNEYKQDFEHDEQGESL